MPATNCLSSLLADKEKKGHEPSEAEIRLASESCSRDRLCYQTADYAYRKCLCNPEMTHPIAQTLLQLALARRDHGILPYSGGYMEQPAVFMDLIDITLKILRDIEEEDQAQRNKAAKTKR